MKTKCCNGTVHGEQVEAHYFIPDQEERDEGKTPCFYIDCLDLLVLEEAGTLGDTFGSFTVDALSLFMEEAENEEYAEVVAEWLEAAAATVRAKFEKQP